MQLHYLGARIVFIGEADLNETNTDNRLAPTRAYIAANIDTVRRL
jgi:hypothetical protein